MSTLQAIFSVDYKALRDITDRLAETKRATVADALLRLLSNRQDRLQDDITLFEEVGLDWAISLQSGGPHVPDFGCRTGKALAKAIHGGFENSDGLTIVGMETKEI